MRAAEYPGEMIRVLLVDDHDLVRAGFCRLLQDCPDVEVVGEAGSGQEALRLVCRLKPDLVLMDLSMPGMDGIETTRTVVEENPGVRVLILTMHRGEEYAVRALAAGARGFLEKKASRQDLIQAVRKVAAGGFYLSPELSARLPQRYTQKGKEASPLELLSHRELQVLKRLAEGSTLREIAQELHLGVKTVETYRARLLAKLGLRTPVALVRFALRHGVIEDTW